MDKRNDSSQSATNLFDFLKWLIDPEHLGRLAWFLCGVVVFAKITDVVNWPWSAIGIVGAVSTLLGRIQKLVR